MTEDRIAGWASKIKLGPLLSSKTGSATVIMHQSMSSPRGGGGGHTQEDLTFLPIFMSNALPRGANTDVKYPFPGSKFCLI